MVSEWMEFGNIIEFVERDKDVNRIELVRCPSIPIPTKPNRCSIQLVDVASGLAYMHGLCMVHGDLKGVHLFFKSAVSALTLHSSEGEHPRQQRPTSLPRRLRSFDNHWHRDLRHRWGLSGVVDFKRHTHVVYRRGDPSVDES